MDRVEFEALRDLPNKTISADIEFLPNKGIATSLNFRGIMVENSLGYSIELIGCYKPAIPALVFNFYVEGVGPICRLCVNNRPHGDVGRTHKHSLEKETCPDDNLPFAAAKNEFDLSSQTVNDIWTILCVEANIVHTGILKEPR